jgi:hypothetical protein
MEPPLPVAHGSKDVQKFHRHFSKSSCITIPRARYGSFESTREEISDRVPSFIDPTKFETLRFRYQAAPRGKLHKRIDGPSKSIIDVSKISLEDLASHQAKWSWMDYKKGNAHRVVQSCPSAWINDKFPLRLHHYHGSWEAYSYRQDTRRTFDTWKAFAVLQEGGPDDEVRPWIQGFVDLVGVEASKSLLAGAGVFSSGKWTVNVTSPTKIQSQKNKLEFVHITKTGGTSVEVEAARAGIRWGACHVRTLETCRPVWPPDWQRSGVRPMYDLLSNAPVQARRTPWHIPPSWFANSPYEGSATFTIVRNPYERYISEYYCPWFGLNRGKPGNQTKEENPDTLNQWLSERLRGLHTAASHHMLPQHFYVYDWNGTKVIDHVLRFESLQQDFAKLMQQYELPLNLSDKAMNKAKVSEKKRMTVADLFPSTIQLINHYAAEDFRRFGYKMIDAVNETETLQRK